MLSRKQLLFGLLALNLSYVATAHGSVPNQTKSQRIGLVELKEFGVVIWNSTSKKWEIDLVKLNEVLATKQIEVTPFDSHEIFTDDLNGPVAIGNW